jgi:hypothetical protein
MADTRFGFWTGPCGVEYLAAQLRINAEVQDVVTGTERIYFRMSPAWEQAADQTGLLSAAVNVVEETFPTARFRVYEA